MLSLSRAIGQNDQDSSFRFIPTIDFSRVVLAYQDAMSGWTALGNPDPVFEILKRRKIAPPWLQMIRQLENLWRISIQIQCPHGLQLAIGVGSVTWFVALWSSMNVV